MPDKEKVIKGLEMCTKPTPSYCRQCPYREIPDDYPHCVHDRLQQDALVLLKEQGNTINELQNAYEYLQKQFFEVQDKLLKEQEKRIKDLQDHCDIRRSVKLGCLIEKK